VAAILPLVLGMLMGNLDRQMRAFLAPAVPVLIPFFAFALGANIDLATVWKAGILGIGLGVFVVVATGVVLFLTDKLTGGNGTAGLAASATILVATSVVVTAILVPVVTAWWYRRASASVPAAAAEAAAKAPVPP